eukprot:CAMPEP_0206551746 /NCGR_PEP_ID=MMETSP0325_2-20121206/15698_1 /ASSEMBLY_ACC=CAM_ASM_000347 /TAXON_ID=2866 /ORGANISM="Crypthecodinium cohnii, Strain Seligo" /LENGTH=915 /DNA_ID=CAMNT_0054051547 /DNA_START=405 /DNA_END=3148 /DNA_ORIENTATION=+
MCCSSSPSSSSSGWSTARSRLSTDAGSSVDRRAGSSGGYRSWPATEWEYQMHPGASGAPSLDISALSQRLAAVAAATASSSPSTMGGMEANINIMSLESFSSLVAMDPTLACQGLPRVPVPLSAVSTLPLATMGGFPGNETLGPAASDDDVDRHSITTVGFDAEGVRQETAQRGFLRAPCRPWECPEERAEEPDIASMADFGDYGDFCDFGESALCDSSILDDGVLAEDDGQSSIDDCTTVASTTSASTRKKPTRRAGKRAKGRPCHKRGLEAAAANQLSNNETPGREDNISTLRSSPLCCSSENSTELSTGRRNNESVVEKTAESRSKGAEEAVSSTHTEVAAAARTTTISPAPARDMPASSTTKTAPAPGAAAAAAAPEPAAAAAATAADGSKPTQVPAEEAAACPPDVANTIDSAASVSTKLCFTATPTFAKRQSVPIAQQVPEVDVLGHYNRLPSSFAAASSSSSKSSFNESDMKRRPLLLSRGSGMERQAPVVSLLSAISEETSTMYKCSEGFLESSVEQALDCGLPEKLVGKRALLTGLKKITAFNGEWGKIEFYDPSSDRYIVEVLLASGSPIKAKLKRENLIIPPTLSLSLEEEAKAEADKMLVDSDSDDAEDNVSNQVSPPKAAEKEQEQEQEQKQGTAAAEEENLQEQQLQQLMLLQKERLQQQKELQMLLPGSSTLPPADGTSPQAPAAKQPPTSKAKAKAKAKSKAQGKAKAKPKASAAEGNLNQQQQQQQQQQQPEPEQVQPQGQQPEVVASLPMSTTSSSSSFSASSASTPKAGAKAAAKAKGKAKAKAKASQAPSAVPSSSGQVPDAKSTKSTKTTTAAAATTTTSGKSTTTTTTTTTTTYTTSIKFHPPAPAPARRSSIVSLGAPRHPGGSSPPLMSSSSSMPPSSSSASSSRSPPKGA